MACARQLHYELVHHSGCASSSLDKTATISVRSVSQATAMPVVGQAEVQSPGPKEPSGTDYMATTTGLVPGSPEGLSCQCGTEHSTPLHPSSCRHLNPASGKINKVDRRMEHSRVGGTAPGVSEQTELYTGIRKVWGSCLGASVRNMLEQYTTTSSHVIGRCT
jgi:hypothetical protein